MEDWISEAFEDAERENSEFVEAENALLEALPFVYSTVIENADRPVSEFIKDRMAEDDMFARAFSELASAFFFAGIMEGKRKGRRGGNEKHTINK